METSFWGPAAWKLGHSITFNYPHNPTPEDKQKYYNYFKNLGDILPCPSCSKSYKIYFKYIPINDFLEDIYGITFWFYTIHYLVNKKLNKKNISFHQVVKIYYSQKASCPKVVDLTNLNGKCTAKPTQEADVNTKYAEFKNITETKYLKKIADYIAVLIKSPEYLAMMNIVK